MGFKFEIREAATFRPCIVALFGTLIEGRMRMNCGVSVKLSDETEYRVVGTAFERNRKPIDELTAEADKTEDAFLIQSTEIWHKIKSGQAVPVELAWGG